jgi:hypothetical protein
LYFKYNSIFNEMQPCGIMIRRFFKINIFGYWRINTGYLIRVTCPCPMLKMPCQTPIIKEEREA